MESLQEATVLVTGADGFAGRHLCEALKERNVYVKGLVRTEAENVQCDEIVIGDLLDYASLQNACKDVDVIFHLAAITSIPESRTMMYNTMQTNATGTLNILLAAKGRAKTFVYVSSGHVYGGSESHLTEDSNVNPKDVYSISKLAGEYLTLSFKPYMKVVIVRPFNHYGEYQKRSFLIPTVITRMLNGNVVKLGNLWPVRDYTYVKDIVDGYILLAEKGKGGETYNLCSGAGVSVKELVYKIAKLVGFKGEVVSEKGRSVEIDKLVGSPAKAESLGWRRLYSQEEGLKRTVEWYKNRYGLHEGN